MEFYAHCLCTKQWQKEKCLQILPLSRLRGVRCNKDKWKFQVHHSITLTQNWWPQGGEVHKWNSERLMRFSERALGNNGNWEPRSSITLFSHSGTVMPQVITYPLLCYCRSPLFCSTALTTALQLPAWHVVKALCSQLLTGLERPSLCLLWLQALPPHFLAETSLSPLWVLLVSRALVSYLFWLFISSQMDHLPSFIQQYYY